VKKGKEKKYKKNGNLLSKLKRKITKEEVQEMKFIVTIERDEDGMFVVECPSIPGCVSQGKTEQEAVVNIKDAIKQCLEVRSEKGMPLTVSMREVEVLV